MSELLGTPVASNNTQQATFIKALPKVSVIIPVARPELGALAIESLNHQSYTGQVEIIVVGEAANELAQHWSIIPVDRGPVRDPGKTRNLGVSYATGEILLFLDDDCTAKEDWIEQNVQAIQQPGIGAVGGRIRGKSNAFFARCSDFTNFGYYQYGSSLVDGPLASASLGVFRDIYQEIGGFDEEMHYGEDEDIDLCYRIKKRGYRTVYEPKITVLHDHRRNTLSKLLRQNYKLGRSSGLTTKVRYRNLGLKNRLLASVRFPPLFLVLVPCIALAATLRIVGTNIRYDKMVLLYAPFILLAKLVYEFGIFQALAAAHHRK